MEKPLARKFKAFTRNQDWEVFFSRLKLAAVIAVAMEQVGLCYRCKAKHNTKEPCHTV